MTAPTSELVPAAMLAAAWVAANSVALSSASVAAALGGGGAFDGIGGGAAGFLFLPALGSSGPATTDLKYLISRKIASKTAVVRSRLNRNAELPHGSFWLRQPPPESWFERSSCGDAAVDRTQDAEELRL